LFGTPMAIPIGRFTAMIINKPGIGLARPNPNRRTILTSALTPPNDTTAPAQRKPDPEPGVRKRHDARDRVELEAAITTLAADGNSLLDDMEDDDGQDPFDLADRFGRSFDERAGATFAPITDPARKASAFRKLQPVRTRLMAVARIMQDEAADRSLANTVFKSAEAVLARAQIDPEETADMLERVAGVIDATDLTPERKDQVAAAIAARAVTSGLEDMLGPRIKKHVPAGRQFLAGLQAERAENTGAPIGQNESFTTSEDVQNIGAPDRHQLARSEEDESVTSEEEMSDIDFNEQEIDFIVRKIRRLISDDIVNESARLDPKGVDKFVTAEEIFQFFQRTKQMTVERVKTLSLRAGLNPEIMAVFHQIFHVTPDTVEKVRMSVRRVIFPRLAIEKRPGATKRTSDQHKKPFNNALDLIADAEPEERRRTVDAWMEILIKYFRLAVPMSDKDQEEFVKKLDDPIRGTGGDARRSLIPR